jgi:hypothetical protein
MALTGYQTVGKLFQKNLKHNRKRWKVDDRLWIPLFQRWTTVSSDRAFQIFLKLNLELIVWHGRAALGGRLIFVGWTYGVSAIRPQLKLENNDCPKLEI